jgi:Uncharacterized conserved protein
MKRNLILLVCFCVLAINICQAHNYLQEWDACFDKGYLLGYSSTTDETTPDTKIHIEWVDIPSGTFMMGSPESEAERYENEYQHQVSVDGFKMSKYAITFEQYDAFCEDTGRSKPSDSDMGRGKRPVINVSWDDAVAFTLWLGGGSRLPTEAEWEYACRAGTTTTFNTGDNLTTSQANYDGNRPFNNNAKGVYREQTLPVGSFSPNVWDLYDMNGNTWEWCLDWFDADYYRSSPLHNPQGPSSGIDRVLRGGSWSGSGRGCRSADRGYLTPTVSDSIIGFRVVVPK